MYFTLVPEGNGCYKLTSNTASRVELQAGAGAEAVRAGLSDKVGTMSAVCGKSHDDKLKEKFQQVSLIMVSHVKSMDATTGSTRTVTSLFQLCMSKMFAA